MTVEALSKRRPLPGRADPAGPRHHAARLESGTASLRVPTGEVRDFPTNTSDALTSGGTYAITGAIERLYRHLQAREGRAPWC